MKTQLRGFIIRILIFSSFFSSVSVFWGFRFFSFLLPVTVCIEMRRISNIALKFLTKVLVGRRYSMEESNKTIEIIDFGANLTCDEQIYPCNAFLRNSFTEI